MPYDLMQSHHWMSGVAALPVARAWGVPHVQSFHSVAAHPGDPLLQYLAGVACMRLQLWGKAQQLLMQSLPRMQGSSLEGKALENLALLAEQRGDSAAAARAWRKAAIAMSA